MKISARATLVALTVCSISIALAACSDDDGGSAGGAGAATGGSAGKAGSAGATGGASGGAGKAGAGAGQAGSTSGGSAGAAAGGSAGSTTGGAAGATAGGAAGSTSGGAAGSTAGGSAGSTSAGAAGSTSGGSAGSTAGGAAGSTAGGAAGSTAGGAGGGIVCPAVGATVAVPAGTSSAAGPTSATKDAATGTCVGGGTVEQLVQLVPGANGTLEITIKPQNANFQPAAYLRTGACDGVEAVCSAGAALSVQATKDAPLFLYVEAANPGAFTIETKLTPKDTGADACAAARPAVSLAANNAIGPTGDTTQGASNVTPPASCAAAASGKEIVFTLVPKVAGDLELAILTENAAFDGVLSVVADCAAPSTTLKCVNAAGPGGTEETVMPVEANKTYYVIVDTLGAGGEFTLSANLVTDQ